MAKILVIDDDALMLELISQVLGAAGHTVVTHQRARRGVQQIGPEQPDLLITDIFMPEVDGLEIVKRAHEARPDMPIIAISGGSTLDQSDYLPVAEAFGAASIIQKPFRPAELVALVSRLLAEA
jgi:DNA-binding NtrC family response regulator